MSEFLWGVATSAYQSEGGYNGPGQPQTNWAAAERRRDVAPSGVGADFWNRYPEDFARCREIGLNAFGRNMAVCTDGNVNAIKTDISRNRGRIANAGPL